MNEPDILLVAGNRRLSDPESIRIQIEEYLDEQVPDMAITGLALGADQVFAEVCFESGIPVHAYVPFAAQAERWSNAQRAHYYELLDRCESVTTLCNSFSNAAYHIRNYAMVKAANRAVIVHDNVGRGTTSAIHLLKKKHVPTTIIQNKKQ